MSLPSSLLLLLLVFENAKILVGRTTRSREKKGDDLTRLKNNQFLIFNFPFPIPYSPFPIPHSPFPIPHSPFLVLVTSLFARCLEAYIYQEESLSIFSLFYTLNTRC